LSTLEDVYLKQIVDIFEQGNESELYIDTVKFLFKQILEEKANETFEMTKYFQSAISIHARLRSSRYNADFNGPLLSWYRRFIGLHGDKE
jgi:hypothetical protein